MVWENVRKNIINSVFMVMFAVLGWWGNWFYEDREKLKDRIDELEKEVLILKVKDRNKKCDKP